MMRLPRNTILTGDATTRLRELPSVTVDCVITSPPYFGLRDYGVAGQLGLEPTVDAWVAGLRPVFRQLARVLKPSGCVWLNLGDSFSRHGRYGAPPKGLLLAPERLVLALAGDGWLVRNKVIWAKTNPLPSSATDRLTLTYEVVYFLVRSKRYYFDLDAIRQPYRSVPAKHGRRASARSATWAGPLAAPRDGLRRIQAVGPAGHVRLKNPGDVWPLATRGYAGAHFATFPETLVRRPLLATCPPVTCTTCGSPARSEHRLGCRCNAPLTPGLVLDPFFGTGTVGVVARQLDRDWLGIELSPAYVRLAWQRLGRSAVTHERGAPARVAA